MNGMTVLAAGTGESEVTALSPEENEDNAGDETGVSSEGDELKGDTDDGEKESEDKKQEGSEEKSEDDTEEKTEEGTEEGSETDDETGDGSLEDDNTEEVPEEEAPDAEELLPGEETLTEETEEKVSEEEEKKEIEARPEVRMVTFTDDTGMRVTYDANEAAAYKYTVAAGVLTAVTNADDTPVSGNVVLSQPGNDDTYEAFTSIAASVFAGNTGITYVKVPTGVTGISDGGFQGCSALKGVYLPSGVTSIGISAFEGCTGLTQISIPKSVTTIEKRAFYQNSKLFMVYMKDSDYSELTTIGEEAFYECKALTEFCSDMAFVMPGNLATIGNRAFYNCRTIAKVDFNESVSSLGEGAFQDCTSLKQVVLSSKLETISKYAFAGCNNLVGVTFKTGNKTIGEYAFSGCYNLGGIVLSYSIDTIERCAFQNCSNMLTAEIPNGGVTIGDGAFPNISTLTLVGVDGSAVYEYTRDKAIKFAGYKSYTTDYYTYKTQTLGDGQGVLTVKDANGKDPNTLNSKKGVAYGTKLYVYYEQKTGSKLVADSVKCNGELLQKDSSGKYYFTMPIGGALITAEFENTASSTNAAGLDTDISVELSNGEITTDSRNVITEVELKIGQYSRMFLIDSKDDNKAVDSSKITYKSSATSVATVTSSGMIHAVKSGTAKITATLKGGDGAYITKEIRVNVISADVKSLKVKASSYDAAYIKLTESPSDGIQTATVDKKDVKKPLTFKIKATAYDAADDNTSVALKWSTSDAKVAKLSSTSTTASSPINTVTIPAGTDGEATITVTATNADKKTITQKFIVSVKDYTPRLASSSLTINPNKEDGALLKIINAYDKEVVTETVKLEYSNSKTQTTDFKLQYLAGESSGGVSVYRVLPSNGLQNKTYSVNVSVNDGDYTIPLKITVKATAPSPKIAFQKNQKKLNLFLKQDTTEFKINVTNLGKDTVRSYTLEPLSTSEDDHKFVENFEITSFDGNSCVIKQKSDSLIYTSKNKPAVTGYLVLRYTNYKDTVEKKFKITIPTQTVAPSFALNKTTDTYNMGSTNQSVVLTLLDKKNKNAVVDLSSSGYHVSIKPGSITTVKPDGVSDDTCITAEGKIGLSMTKVSAGKVYLVVTNDAWAPGKSFTYTYTIKTSSAAPKINLGSSTVTLNPSYPEQAASFTLRSDQTDTVITDTQTFVANTNSKTKESLKLEYDKLSVVYENGEGEVSIEDSTIKDGTYSFVCTTKYDFKGNTLSSNKVTLKVKVAKGVPTVTVKGSAALNTQATDEHEQYVEKAELTLSTKKPADYAINAEATEQNIVCTTKTEFGDRFDWEITGDKLIVSLNGWCPSRTYSFNVTPVFVNDNLEESRTVTGKTFKVNVKVYSGEISVSLSGKGKVNLLDRAGQCTTSNSIVYTPSFKNLKDSVLDAAVYDANGNTAPVYSEDGMNESEFFDVQVSGGKLYVYPKAGAPLENNKTYKIMIWMKLDKYQAFDSSDGNGTWSKVLSIKTAQILPKVTTDKSTVNLYLSNKNYKATFIVDKKDAKAVGSLVGIAFGEKDTNAENSFVIESEEQPNGSLKVTLQLKDTVSYSCNTTNKIKMYVKFKGQGTNTDGVPIVMNVKIVK